MNEISQQQSVFLFKLLLFLFKFNYFYLIESMLNDKNAQKLTKSLLKELSYYNKNIVVCHGEFNIITTKSSLPTKKYLQKLYSIYDLDILQIRSNYYSPKCFNNFKQSNKVFNENSFLILHNNERSLRANLENFQEHLFNKLNYNFDVLGISETKITNSSDHSIDFNLNMEGYSFEYVPTPLASGGVGMYINNNLRYSVLEKTSHKSF